MKLEQEKEKLKFISDVKAYYEPTPTYGKKRIKKIHHDFNKQKYNCKNFSGRLF